VLDSIKIKLQYLLPKQGLTRLAGWGAERRAAMLTQWVIKGFARYYKVDMKEAQEPDLRSYATFNDFFVRPLREGARPIVSGLDMLSASLPGNRASENRAYSTHYYPLPRNQFWLMMSLITQD